MKMINSLKDALKLGLALGIALSVFGLMIWLITIVC